MSSHSPDVDDEARARLAEALDRRADDIARRWEEAAGGGPPITPGVEEVPPDASAARPVVLTALLERLRRPDDPRRASDLQALLHQWHEAGLVGDEMDPYFEWLREAGVGALTTDARQEGLRAVFERELGELRLEVSNLESALLHEERDELHAQLEALFEHVPEPVVVAETTRGRIRTANAAAAEFTGFPPSRLRTMALSDLCPGLAGPDLRAFIGELVDRGDARRDDLTLVRHDGTEAGCAVAAHLVNLGGGPAAFCFLRPAGGERLSVAAYREESEALHTRIETQADEVGRLTTFLENIISALPIRLLVLDSDLTIIHANPAYYVQRGLAREEVIGRPISDVFTPDLLETAGLRAALLSVLETGERVRWSGYREATPKHGERVLNIRLDPCEGPDGGRNVLVTLEDITERHTQLYERTILQQISHALLGELDLPKLLHAILTGMTAGGAIGLGFNRAILLLVDEDVGVLNAEMAVGPENLEEALAIWQEIAQDHRTLQDFLADYEHLPPPDERPLKDLVEKLVFPLDDVECLPMAAVVAHETVHVVDAEMDPRAPRQLRELLGTDEFVVAPLVAREKIIGAAIADNRFTQQPINQGAIQLLTALANQAALAIDTATTFRRAKEDAERLDRALRALQEAEEEKLRTAKLAAIGEITAIVAHEIRSPLSAIGGFARSIAREPDLVKRSERNANIIVEEVARLERILGDLLAFSKPSEPEFAMVDLAPVIHSVAENITQAEESNDIELVVDIAPDAPQALVDEKQVRQILTNLATNAVQAMPAGGTLTFALRTSEDTVDVLVQDTGEGIPEERLEHIFDAFFTSKPTGTGLGLALCSKLVTQLGATMDVRSRVGEGTTFVVRFPIPGADAREADDEEA